MMISNFKKNGPHGLYKNTLALRLIHYSWIQDKLLFNVTSLRKLYLNTRSVELKTMCPPCVNDVLGKKLSDQCLSSAYDAGPTLIQQWLALTFLLG